MKSISQKKLTMSGQREPEEQCPAQSLLKMLSGRWRPEIFRYAASGPVRFNHLLRDLPGLNRQSLSMALKELEDQGLLERVVIRQKPLHVEYGLTEKGKSLIPVFEQLESFS